MNQKPLDTGFTKVEKVVEKVLRENQRQDLLYFTRIYKHWHVIVGEQLAKKTFPEKLQKSTLYVMVEDSAYSQQLRYFVPTILELIASPEICDENVVKKIVFRVGERRQILESPLEIISKVETDDVELRERIEEVKSKPSVRNISDKGLRQAFSRCMAKLNPSRNHQKEKKGN